MINTIQWDKERLLVMQDGEAVFNSEMTDLKNHPAYMDIEADLRDLLNKMQV